MPTELSQPPEPRRNLGVALVHLARAERRVVEGEQHITWQRKLIADLERGGQDTEAARELLRRLEEKLLLHFLDRDRLRDEFKSG
jgi:hypothetical protein